MVMIMSSARKILFMIFSAAAFALFVTLGVWQLHRLSEKEAVIAPMRAFDPRTVSIMTVDVDNNQGDSQFYTYVSRRGMLDQTKPIFRPGAINPYSKTGADRLGYDLYLPLTQNGRAILVNFGWIDNDMRDLMMRNAHEKKVSPIPVIINGWVIPGQRQKTFTPDNNPLKNDWFWQDWDALSGYTGYQFLPWVLYNDLNWYGATRPSLWQNIPNNHREYAWTWFGLALVQLAMTITYGFKNRG
jgi:surfeit locus 1 family protein